MIRTLITGGAGFIGHAIAQSLSKQGHHVDLIDNFQRGVHDKDLAELLSHSNVNFASLDLCEIGSLDRFGTDYDFIYHLAAIIGVQNVLENPFDVLQDNQRMLFNVLDFAKRQSALKRFIFTSTSEIYAGSLAHMELVIPTPEAFPIALTDLNHPRTSYMLSKIYGEALCLQSGLPVTIVRPHNIYGPRMGMAHVIPQQMQRIYSSDAGQKLIVYSPTHRRTFCFIDDAVKMIVALAAHKDGTGAYNIGNQKPEIDMHSLVIQILDTLDRDLNIVAGETTPGSPERRCPDIQKVVKTTGVEPDISLEEGLSLTWRWYKKSIFENGETTAR